ncbi:MULTISPECIES: universal stress protein [Nostocales]|jgi:nucleotide-binding universal stress UspA family protein|uniref:Universal stress protein n=2 Tax=Aphanizomenonaceae TaxID=1892259 RepID=A0ACC7S567_DOLFA|nr:MULTISPECIES: universal stress protein [Nostocales]MBO1070904.1 universal stress protein [Dolichospermum sp. DEX189]MCX5981776.1 universal stress protein [Nostocales cyanobacterium LacPavin_0920_SED1_MAG_38_18]ALB42873.1 universal stress protein UspA [Anabaena sp. WA102]MBD2279010.1 universal stress protein [Aphanizomenon flos-aquae FACHB-1040]MBO1067659.1 universal stress protein [Anabaena sp. 54]
MIQKILLAVSGLGHAEEMLKNLKELPSFRGAKVTVLHVVTPQSTASVMTDKWEEGGKILAKAIQYLNLDPSQVSSILRQGDPKDVVCQVADEMEADLIIMGSRGMKRLQSIFSNSVSQYVFQLSSRPMLLVKDDIYVKNIKRVMVAMDNSDAAKNCLNLALFLLRGVTGGQLVLANINADLGGKLSGITDLKPEKNSVLGMALAEAQRQSVAVRCVTSSGKPGEEICRLTNELNIDLLLIGSPDRRPSIAKSFVDIDRLIGSSLSDYVRVNSTCPVLLVRTTV